jgi:nucleoside-diphosphate-sugar epimerase
MRGNIYNLGLSSANITKLQLAEKVKKYIKALKIKIIYGVKDPDQRDYFVSNKKIENIGFKAKTSLDTGINEMIEVFNNDKLKIQNNY